MDRIVVGVDGSANSAHALAWAVEEAKLRSAALDVVMVWREPLYGHVSGIPVPVPLTGPEFEEPYRERLDEIVDSLALDEGMPVRRMLRNGTATAELLAAAEGADLLVVGSRGQGGFVGLLLGSVTTQVAAHATCPVVIVPADEPDGR